MACKIVNSRAFSTIEIEAGMIPTLRDYIENALA